MDYLQARHQATVFQGSKVLEGQCDPRFFRSFVKLLCGRVPSSRVVIWEPFAGHGMLSDSLEFCDGLAGVVLIAHDIQSDDSRVTKADSTKCGPTLQPHGMFFHPPYFGSRPFSNEPGELSLLTDGQEYYEALKKTIALANLYDGGMVCAVGRNYRYGGQAVTLPRRFLEIFTACGYVLEEVWLSEPDEALVMRRTQ